LLLESIVGGGASMASAWPLRWCRARAWLVMRAKDAAAMAWMVDKGAGVKPDLGRRGVVGCGAPGVRASLTTRPDAPPRPGERIAPTRSLEVADAEGLVPVRRVTSGDGW
jgi:hypothetical protein